MDTDLLVIIDNVRRIAVDDERVKLYNKASLEDIKKRLHDLSTYSNNLLKSYNMTKDPVAREYLLDRLNDSNTEIIFISVYTFARLLRLASTDK